MGDLVFTGRETVGVVDDDLLLVVEVCPVHLLVSLQLVHVGADRNVRSGVGVPGRSAAHLQGLAGLDTLQEAVLLSLLAGLVREVHLLVVRHTDVQPLEGAQQSVGSVVSPEAGEHQGVGHEVVVVRVVQEHSVGQPHVQAKHQGVLHHVSLEVLRQGEGITAAHVHCSHGLLPQSWVLLIIFSFQIMDHIFYRIIK